MSDFVHCVLKSAMFPMRVFPFWGQFWGQNTEFPFGYNMPCLVHPGRIYAIGGILPPRGLLGDLFFVYALSSTSPQTILTAKFASCLHLLIICPLISSVIPFILSRRRTIKFLMNTLLESISITS